MRRLACLLAPSLLALCCGNVLAQSSGEPVPNGRLPTWAVPERYSLALKIDPEQTQFSGRTTIRVQLKQASDHLWLHGKELKVSKVTVKPGKGKALTARYVEADAQTGVARLDFGRTLSPQTLTVEIAYSAPLNQQLQGLYQVKYQGKAYAMTQMEPISARYAFPGFDEPAFKTPFDISLTVPNDDQALANTIATSTKPAGKGWKTVTFAPTVPLPTYLVAYAAGPWDVVDVAPMPATPQRPNATPLRGIAAKGQGPRITPALDQTPAIIAALEDYYAFGYPFDKLDLVAAPDFSAGAMENPGFVTFRDWLLLLDKDSPAENVQRSFNVNAHELAHQWTGDTVTMAWWDDLWLNEAFATWMQQKITMQLHPEYHANLDRIGGAQHAMENDSLVSARKIRQPITGNGDIETAFDGITYQKGAAVLAMFEAFVGEDVFRQGMRAYIAKHKFGNATADDLVDAIAEAAGKGDDFKAAFRSFLNQPGVPYLQTQVAREGGKTVVMLQQQRYLPLGSSGSAAQQWGVPVCVKYGKGKNQVGTACQLLEGGSGSIVLEGAGKNTWVFPNARGAGYYRFSLPSKQLAALGKQVGQLDDNEQLAYADAINAAYRHGDADNAAVLAALAQLAPSASADVSTALLDRFGWIWRYQATTEAQRGALRKAAEQAYLPRLRALGYTRRSGESIDDTALRTSLASVFALRLQNAEVRKALLAQGDAVLAGGKGALDFSAANPDLLGTVLAVTVQERGAPAVQALIDALRTHADPAQRNAMIAALGAVQDPALLKQVRDFALTDAIKVGEMKSLLMRGHSDERSHESMWAWFTANFDRIVQRSGSFDGGGLPALGASGGCSVDEADRLDAFFKPRLAKLSGADRGLAQTGETIRLCAALRQAQARKR
ncbi:M1 family metallopeptidase [Xanthomonas euvesicatoria pv. allii]|uniref:M1 family metallopeptidase n=1 Tax=Xanthomonas euvesicatoria TaxID=456327 RepID=UPI002405C5DB|nr:M1 family metallopeptidase [Xanthomonas euvesicatoria]MCP3046166.1 M1 family metallopeptidase [Xanthomonas euvesicatoria pv. allii]